MGIILPSVCQLTDSHCGPATVQLLLAHRHIQVSQEEIVRAARAAERIKKYGTRPDHLARAVARLAPQCRFWFKEYGTIRDLVSLIHTYGTPVAINWQGLFYDTLAQERHDFPHKNRYGDHGHYSVVVDVDPEADTITIADTYSEYYLKPRVFSYTWFKTRWWDYDLHLDKSTGKKYSLKTERLLFVVVPKEAPFPALLHLKPAADLPSMEPVEVPFSFGTFFGQLLSHRH